MSEWRETALGEICNFRRGHDLPKTKMEKGSYPVAGSNGIIGYHNEFTTPSPCITIGRSGNIGNPYIYKQNTWAHNTTLYIDNFKGTNPVFLYYYLQTLDLCHFGGGSAVPTLNRNHIHPISVSIPAEVTEQKAIADILSCLDDKIESNNKINQTLEEMAQAIFKSWFVDFEPFGGEMPEDWESQDIYAIANIVYGAPFKSKLFNTEKNGIPIIRIRDLKKETSDVYTTEIHPKGRLIERGDIVVGMDGEFKPYVWGGENSWLNQRVCIFENKRPKGKCFLYSTIKPLLDYVEKTEVATTVIHIGKADFDVFKFTLPDMNTLDKFDDLTFPMYQQIVSNKQETQTLIEIRNTLLPKLMSGEVRVPVGEVE